MDLISPLHSDSSSPLEHVKVPLAKGIDTLKGFLADLQELNEIDSLPPAMQQLLTLSRQVADNLEGKDAYTLGEFSNVIPTLRKAIASLEPLVNQIKVELARDDENELGDGPFSSAWTNALIGRATSELTALRNLLQ